MIRVFSIGNGLFVNGTLYGFDYVSDAIVTIDTSTGMGTKVGTYDLGGDVIYSSAVPEPSSLVLGLIGVALAGSFRFARHRRRRSEHTAGLGD